LTAPEIRRLRETATRIEELLEQGPQSIFASQADTDFHRQMGSRNKWIERELCGDLYSLLRLYRLHTVRRPGGSARVTAKEHAPSSTVSMRNADCAEQVMRAHVRRSRDWLLAQIRAQGA
jgi:DNA-binding GntR family transcriptional regulator